MADDEAKEIPLPEPDSDAGVIPEELPLLPLRNEVAFPHMVLPLRVGRDKGKRLIDDVLVGHKMLGLVTQRKPDNEDPTPDDLYPHLTAARVLRMLKFPDGSAGIITQGMARARVREIQKTNPYMVARVELFEDEVETGVQMDALMHSVQGEFQKIAQNESAQVPEELQVLVMNSKDPGRVADLLASLSGLSIDEKQELLGTASVRRRLELLSGHLARHLQVLELSNKIRGQVQTEFTKLQREHVLREQLKAIHKELGEGEEESADLAELRAKVAEAKLPDEVRKTAEHELERLGNMHPSAAEYAVARTYLDWVVVLPWLTSSRDRLDITRARRRLDADHHGLDRVKERILEYLSVRKLKKDMRGPILCFVGPPGTGKTSLGMSIAGAIGRKFVRLSLGGVRDEAEIRGHRRTYVGALPGRVIQGLRTAGTNNPVFMIDEVDKLGSDFRGDPSSALLEVLDPEQNFSFADHYLDLPFDLSKVMFITTANVLETIPPPLRDRMEVLELPGYTEEEKLAIAQRHLVPKQLAEHGLKPAQLKFTAEALSRIVADYTRESGLRNFERQIAAVCRKVARARVEGGRKRVTVGADRIPSYLGPAKFYREVADRTGRPGVATGLAWTPAGGVILFIEATRMAGSKGLSLTGSLGDVMKESAHAALSYIRAHARELRIAPRFFEQSDIHVHVPAGAISKDGPSAGVAIFASLVSLLRDKPIRTGLAMTGEITLTGRVLPVGGVKDKVLGARRADIHHIILPKHNANDLPELPETARQDMTFHLVESVDEVLPLLFPAKRSRPKRRARQSAKA